MQAVSVHGDVVVVRSEMWQTKCTVVHHGDETFVIDSPERMIVQFVCHIADVATKTSGWTATTLKSRGASPPPRGS